MKITEGTPVTYQIGSDSYGGKVVRVVSDKTVDVQLDHLFDKRRVTLRKGGYWRELNSRAGTFTFGQAISYRDPSF